jgi:hypothetical protein
MPDSTLKMEDDIEQTEVRSVVASEGGGKPKPKAGGKRRKERRGFMVCPGCDESKPVEDFDLGQNVDKGCKKYLDRIYNQCRTQGKVDWFKEMRASPKGTKSILDFYRQLEANCTPGSKSKFNVAQFEEEHRAEQSVDFLDLGTMMWEQQAIEHWQSTPGGSLSHSDAKAKWDHLAANYKDLGIVNDQKSPNKEKPLRLRIHTGDNVNFANRSIHAKTTKLSEAAVKKPKTEDIDRMAGRIMTGFASTGSGSGSVSNQQVAQSMVSAGAGQAFDDIGVKLDDITVLGMNVAKQYDDDEDDNEGKDDKADAATGGGGGGNEQPTPSPRKEEQKGTKRKWLDISKEINSPRRGLRSQLTALTKSYEEVESNIQKGIDTIHALPLQTQKLCQGELALAITRLTAVRSVLCREGTDLESFIKSFSVSADETVPGDTASVVAARKIAKAPPCCNYTELQKITVLNGIIDQVDVCTSPEELKTASEVYNHELGCNQPSCSRCCTLRCCPGRQWWGWAMAGGERDQCVCGRRVALGLLRL